jgi:hypothetical protein
MGQGSGPAASRLAIADPSGAHDEWRCRRPGEGGVSRMEGAEAAGLGREGRRGSWMEKDGGEERSTRG